VFIKLQNARHNITIILLAPEGVDSASACRLRYMNYLFN